MSQAVEAPLHLAGAWDIYPPGGARRRIRSILKQVLFSLYLYCGWITLRDWVLSLIGRSRVVILYYHRVGWVDVLSKPTGDFRSEMQYLARNFQCLTMRQLVDVLQSGTKLRRKVAVVTFDDGYRDNYLSAFPELKRAGIPATFFVTTGYINTERRFPHDTRALERGVAARDDWPKMTWDQLREMQAAGMEIGSHTVEHVSLGKADPETVHRELADSLRTIRQELGDSPRCFCFPWGAEGDVSSEASQLAKQLGYYSALTTINGTVKPTDDLFQLRRIDVGNGQVTRLGALAAVEGLGCGWLARYLRR